MKVMKDWPTTARSTITSQIRKIDFHTLPNCFFSVPINPRMPCLHFWGGHRHPQVDHYCQPDGHGRRHGRKAPGGHDGGDEKGAHAKGQGAAGVEHGHAKAFAVAGIERNHAGHGGVKQRGPHRPQGDEQHQHPIAAGDAGKGNEDHGHEQTAENDGAALVTVGQVTGHRLNDKGEKPVDAGNQPHLGQVRFSLSMNAGNSGVVKAL
jgi:hypothetical protein